ncbi:hypothetical protein Hanom_Chr16g01493241 [Helianthus anomalus]
MCLIVKVRDLASWIVINVGTGNDLLQELAKQGCVFYFFSYSFSISLIFDIDEKIQFSCMKYIVDICN